MGLFNKPTHSYNLKFFLKVMNLMHSDTTNQPKLTVEHQGQQKNSPNGAIRNCLLRFSAVLNLNKFKF